MGKDPVCHEDVDERSAWSSTYQDKVYYFNSPECKADFDRDPGRYAAAPYGAAEEAGSIREQGGRVASRARTKVRSMITERKGIAADRIGAISNAFKNVSQQLRDQKQNAVARYTDQAAENVDRISGYLREHDAEKIMSDAEDFVRRRPGLVIGTAFVAGFLAARFLKSSKSVSA